MKNRNIGIRRVYIPAENVRAKISSKMAQMRPVAHFIIVKLVALMVYLSPGMVIRRKRKKSLELFRLIYY